MSTLQQLFPNVKNPAESIEPSPVRATFSAPLLNGKFDFDIEIPSIEVSRTQSGVLAGVALSSNIDQLSFSNVIDPSVNGGTFELSIIRSGNRSRVNKAPFQFAGFNQGGTFSAQFVPTATNNSNEVFILKLKGTLLQTPALISSGVSSVSIVAVLDFYKLKAGA